jgi:hypothetical protein
MSLRSRIRQRKRALVELQQKQALMEEEKTLP